MRYISTRGEAPVLNLPDALLAGLARDGGLYVPETWPAMTPEAIAALSGQPFVDWLGQNEQMHRVLMKEAGFLAQ